ncbi:hypothetical protein YQE_03757, partial [Dendroctonus ponderosae]
MSATFKNAKKMERQEQLRKLLKNHKKVVKEVKKIDSPLAKYNELGQLTCILCKSIVRSEAVWVVHINAKQHKENVEIAKKLKEKTNNFTTPLKRPMTPPMPDIPEKKVKGILKNGVAPSAKATGSGTNNALQINDQSEKPGATHVLSLQQMKNRQKEAAHEDPGDQNASTSIPEGFFDDPIQDAKARNQEYKDPLEVEWNNFLKEMKVIDNESEAIIAEDQDEATTERHMEEIEEQMALFNRVLDLEKKKDVAVELLNKIKNEPRTEDEEDSDDIDEFLDWRQKKAY